MMNYSSIQDEEWKHSVLDALTPLDDDGSFRKESVSACRHAEWAHPEMDLV